MSLYILDTIYTILHYLIIGVNVLAWIPQKTRKIHLITVMATLFSWVALGFWKGFGYCFLTDWQWDIKRQLGERNLPNSFIHYQLEEVFRLDIDEHITNRVTLVVFVLVVIIAIWQHFLKRRLIDYRNIFRRD